MNLSTLEKLARQIIKGEKIGEKGNVMLRNGFITPAEHRSLSSLSWQIAANANATGTAAVITQPIGINGSWY